jgi:ligand-binding sensor domain-containing protein
MKHQAFWILIFLTAAARADYDPFHHHYTGENGLSSNICYDVITDRDGFLWVSTENGVCRFDGKRFVQFGQSG